MPQPTRVLLAAKALYAVLITALFAAVFAGTAMADEIATLRQGVPIDQEAGDPVPMPQVANTDIRSKRNYPMQPPLIPHAIRGYEVNIRVNKCMSCHARGRIEESQAPMISVTHFMDREGNFLAEISPRRYFCNQCHVTQTESRLLIENDFRDMDDLLDERAKSKGR